MISFNFGGRVAIHPGEALYYIGYSRTLEGAKKTARNLMDEAGIQHVLAHQPSPVTVKRGPGRPRKSAQAREAGHEQ